MFDTYFDPNTPPHVSNRVDNIVNTTTTNTSTTTTQTCSETIGSTTISKIIKTTKNVLTTTEIITETTTITSKLHNFQSFNLEKFNLFQCCYYFAEKPFLSPNIFKYIREYIVKTCLFSFLPDSELDRFKAVSNFELLKRLLNIQDVYIAGGSCIPGVKINDIDIYIHSFESFKECLNLFSEENVANYNVLSGVVTVYFYTAYFAPIQLIYVQSEWEIPIQETISHFHFDYCQVAIRLNNTDYTEPRFEWIKTPFASESHQTKVIRYITKCPVRPDKFMNLLKKAYLKGYELPKEITCLAQLNLEWTRWKNTINLYSKEEFMVFELMGDLDYKTRDLMISSSGHVTQNLRDVYKEMEYRKFEPIYVDYVCNKEKKNISQFIRHPQFIYLGDPLFDSNLYNFPKNIEYIPTTPVDIHKHAIIKLLVKAEIAIRQKNWKTAMQINTKIDEIFPEWNYEQLNILCNLLKQVLEGQFYIFEYLYKIIQGFGLKIEFEYKSPTSFKEFITVFDTIFKKYNLFQEIEWGNKLDFPREDIHIPTFI